MFAWCFVTAMTAFALTTAIHYWQQKKTSKKSAEKMAQILEAQKEARLNTFFNLTEQIVNTARARIEYELDERTSLTYAAGEETDAQEDFFQRISTALTQGAKLVEDSEAVYIMLENDGEMQPSTIFLSGNVKYGFFKSTPTGICALFPPTRGNGWYYAPFSDSKAIIPLNEKTDVPTQAYYQSMPPIAIGKEAKRPETISYLAPLYKNGLQIGFVGMDIGFDVVKKIVSPQGEKTTASLLFGKNGLLVATSDDRHFDARTLDEGIEKAGGHTFRTKQLKNGMSLMVISLGNDTEQSLVLHIAQHCIVLFPLMLLVFFIWNYAVRHLINPLNVLTVATYKIARGKLNIDIPYESANEVGILADNIRKMEDQLHDSISYIRAQTEFERKAKEAAITESRSKSEFLASMYLSLHEIDLVEDTVTEVHSHPDIAQTVGASFSTEARKTVRRVLDTRSQGTPKEKADLMEFVNFDTLDERMADRITISQEFLGELGFWCRARFILVDRNSDGTLHHVLWAIENIDEEKRERDKLQHEAERNAAASQAKSTFLANVSHEIRTPINAILGMNEMILREAGDNTILDYSVKIKNAGTTLLSIVNDILDFSKIEAGKMELLPAPYDLSSVLVDLVNMILDRAKKKGLELKVEANPAIPKNLFGDSIRIKQCVMNLLTNAVKYTSKGTITFTVGYEEIGDNEIILTICVSDTGSGIKEADLEKLFSPFERIEEGSNRTIEGTGLGMSIVQKTLSMMGSELSVKSEYGKGSTFSFRLRQTVMGTEKLGDINESFRQSVCILERYKEKLIAPDARILVVDDTEMNLEVVKGLLKNTKITIDTSLSGKDALKKVVQTTYDIIFIDHRMPEMDGIQTLHAMKILAESKNKSTPCICLTANAISGVKHMYLKEGFTDYLSKPVNPEKLEAMIRDYLSGEKILPPEEAPKTEEEAHGSLSPIFARLVAEHAIDYESAIKNCGTEELLLSTLRQYHAKIDETAYELETLFEAEDFPAYATKIHALKSTSRLIGATELSRLSAELEEAADRGDAAKIQEKHKTALGLLKSYKEKLECAVGEDDSGKPEISREHFRESLEKILSCAEDFDIDGLDNIISELGQYQFKDDLKEQFTKVKSFVEKIDFTGLKAFLSADILGG